MIAIVDTRNRVQVDRESDALFLRHIVRDVADDERAIVAALRLVLLDAEFVVNPNQTVTMTAFEAPWQRLMALMEARR